MIEYHYMARKNPVQPSILYNAYLRFRSLLAAHDLAYLLFISTWGLLRPNQKALLASRESDIVIDGFPRSANTYFVSFFEIAQDRPLCIGRHLHESWQFRFAERHHIPCVVLVREPLASVSSAMLRDPRADSATLLGNYVRLYENLLVHRQRAVIAPFEVVVNDANKIIAEVNMVYGAKFQLMADERRDLVAEEVNSKDRAAFGNQQLDPTRIAAPSEKKRAVGKRLRAEIEAEHGVLLDRARLVYRKVLECAFHEA